MKKVIACFTAILTVLLFASCDKTKQVTDTAAQYDLSGMDFSFSDDDLKTKLDTANSVAIDLTNKKITANGNANTNSVAIKDGNITVSGGGTYIFGGSCENTEITVNSSDNQNVWLAFNGATVKNSNGPAICILKSQKTFLFANENTENVLSDGNDYTVSKDGSNIDSAVFSKSDLTLCGKGKLTVNGNYKHSVVTKDNLIVTNLSLRCVSNKSALCGKDCVKMSGANINITAQNNAVMSDNDQDKTKGFVYIKDGNITANSGGDGIQAQTVVKTDGGKCVLTSGGGAVQSSQKNEQQGSPFEKEKTQKNQTDDTTSKKGIKAGGAVIVQNGEININSYDDALHSNGAVEISGGSLAAASGDDGIHADNTLKITGGTVKITQSYEGLEGGAIDISGGDIFVTASDDGLNAAGGSDSSQNPRQTENDRFSGSFGTLNISGGNLTVNAYGDGIDSNGTLNVSGGTVLVSGPVNGGNGALDYGTSAEISGGTVIAAGSSGMAVNFTKASQGSILVSTGTQKGGTAVTLTDSKNKTVCAFTPEKDFECIVISSPNIKTGETYNLLCVEKTVKTITLKENIYTEDGLSSSMPGGMDGGRGGFGGNGEQPPQMPNGNTNGTQPPQMPDGNTPDRNGMPDFQNRRQS
ncbi:MAG: carbohydrate-binding domain-containing protein [Oscillospiraceae bacterium]|nr:carbohydrate-binding domain-containing protein [Candidatus Equicaccousia limihippi]